jgi:hypothetical protein
MKIGHNIYGLNNFTVKNEIKNYLNETIHTYL